MLMRVVCPANFPQNANAGRPRLLISVIADRILIATVALILSPAIRCFLFQFLIVITCTELRF